MVVQLGLDGVFSYAGQTDNPLPQPLPVRVGGFGGVSGLIAYLDIERITHVVDATHPFAEAISRNAVEACGKAGVALCALERAAWEPVAGDDWRNVGSLEEAARALPDSPSRVFLAIGRQEIGLFADRPEHHYLLRMVDPPKLTVPLPDHEVVLGRGPFSEEDDTALLRDRGIELVVSKNSGGTAARAKLDAARALGLPVIMVDRPAMPARRVAASPAEVMDWLGQSENLGV